MGIVIEVDDRIGAEMSRTRVSGLGIDARPALEVGCEIAASHPDRGGLVTREVDVGVAKHLANSREIPAIDRVRVAVQQVLDQEVVDRLGHSRAPPFAPCRSRIDRPIASGSCLSDAIAKLGRS
jgi:hypothetical protein